MQQYKDLIRTILSKGVKKADRTGTGTISIFGYQNRYQMSDGFPLVTVKKTFTKGIIHELLWFLKGDTNIKYLVDNNVHIWDEWAYQRYLKYCQDNSSLDKYSQLEFIEAIKQHTAFAAKFGDLGPIYGKQWVNWEHTTIDGGFLSLEQESINQIDWLVKRLKTNPEDRGLIISAWNVPELPQMALRPCHTMWQVIAEPLTDLERSSYYVAKFGYDDAWKRYGHNPDFYNDTNTPKYKLHLQLYQRSADTMLGVPFNIASYAILLHMIAQCVNMVPGDFIHTFGDAHIYLNHVDAAKEILLKEPMKLPTLKLNPEIKNIFDFKVEDIQIEGYTSHPAVKLQVAV